MIVCTRGPADRLRSCLDALARTEAVDLAEVVVVDDAASEPLRGPWPAGLTVRVVRQTSPQGFLHSANRGAAESGGGQLYFLNDDTAAQPGFLSHALTLLRARPDAGFVASKLVYPDGRLQEAGSALRHDGTASNHGHGASPDDYRFNHVCRVDYGSAAGLMARREVFEALGGFDPAFAPAYYEDVDLQTRGRACGWWTYYQPRSVVVHERGGSYGWQEGSPAAMLQAEHRTLLLGRPGAPGQAGWTPVGRPHLYWFDTLFPRLDHNAGAQRCFELLRLLDEQFQVTFVPLADGGTTAEVEVLTQLGIRVAQDRAGRPVRVDDFLRQTEAEHTPWCVASRPDGAARVAGLLRALRPASRWVYDTVDLAFQRYQTHLARGPAVSAYEQDQRLYRRFRALETHLARTADRVWVVSDEERQVLVQGGLCPAERVAVIPVLYDVQPTSATWAAREHLLFIGGFSHRPNVEAVEFAVSELLPLLVQRGFPGRLLVVGSDPERLAHLRHERLDLLGYQPDLQPYLNRARLAFYPLVSGAGMKGKVGQALAAGLPVVTTALGAQGFGPAGAHLAVADQAEELVAGVRRLYDDVQAWETARAAGLAYAAGHFGRAALRRMMKVAFEETSHEYQRSSEPVAI